MVSSGFGGGGVLDGAVAAGVADGRTRFGDGPAGVILILFPSVSGASVAETGAAVGGCCCGGAAYGD